MKPKKWYPGNAIPRMVFVGISVCLQTLWLLLVALVLNEHYQWIQMATRILSLLVILQLNSKYTNVAYKMPWIMLIMAFPIMGLSLYVMLGVFSDMGNTGKRLQSFRKAVREGLPENEETAHRLEKGNLPGGSLGMYLAKQLHCPVWQDTDVRYYSEAAAAFEGLKADLEKAQSFIFMEYFIVSEGSAFEELREILVRKASEGVDVRFMYDDMGSVGYVNLLFAKKLMDVGIRCTVFNPAIPVLNLFMNHRDHRKITVIDGKVGYTGGFNLSDEYFDRRIAFGKWKDTGIRLEGDGVRSLTAAFLEMWSVSSRKQEPMEPFLQVEHRIPGVAGFVQPYEDNPLGRERVAESVYLNLIYSARDYLYIITPYLIITDEMTNALALAAKRGVDVRIVTPGIPDKKTVYAVTRSYYAGLIRQGVRIFEYTPGFCHAKQILCDGKTASIGTSNLDYRSLYLHFENNVLLYGGDAVRQIEADFEETFSQCREITEDCCRNSRLMRIWQYILRLFAPLM